MRRAEASGSRGSRTSVVGVGDALDASTPALAQTKPWRVRQISTPRSARSDLGGLVEHDLHRARVLALLARPSSRARAPGRDVGERDDRALGLGDDLVGDHDHLPVGRAGSPPRRRDDQRGEVVAGAHLGEAAEARATGRVSAAQAVRCVSAA